MAVDLIRKGSANAHPIISNWVQKIRDDRSILVQMAEALPPEKYKECLNEIIQAKYPKLGYEGVQYDLDLNARPSQLIPFDLNLEWNTFIFNSGRGAGKAVPLDTPIPTPSGWSTMGELKVGDEVFDENGKVCKVTSVTEPFIPDKAYKFNFSDGAEIISCSEHLWVTWTHRDRKAFQRGKNKQSFDCDWVNWVHYKSPNIKTNEFDNYKKVLQMIKEGYSKSKVHETTGVGYPAIDNMLEDKDFWQKRLNARIKTTIGPKIRTTQEIVDSFYQGKRKDLNHCIPLAKSLELSEKELPVDPYLLGLFYGDGTKKDGSITAHKDDYEAYKKYLEDKGFEVGELKLAKKEGIEQNSGGFRVKGLFRALRLADCLDTKKVLTQYLRASEAQRLSLLQGLLDSDGTINRSEVSFCNTNYDIFSLCYELLMSLGQKPTTFEREHTLNGVQAKKAYYVRCVPTRNDLFALSRKRELLEKSFVGKSQQLRNNHRMIESYEEVKPTLMKCITVDSPNSMYLLGKSMIPTHNTWTGSNWIIYLAQKFPGCRIALVGATDNDVINILIYGDSGIVANSPPWFKAHPNRSMKTVTFPNGSSCEYFSAEKPDRLRGRNFSYAWVDEITSWTFPEETMDMLEMTLRKGSDNRILITTTPKNLDTYIKLLKDPGTWTYVGSTFDNKANLSGKYLRRMIDKYSGTRLGQQELEAEILGDDENALWKRDWIEKNRVRVLRNSANEPLFDQFGRFVPEKPLPDFIHVVVAIDPAVSVNKKSAETAISVAAYAEDGNYYVLYADSQKYKPEEWSKAVYEIYDTYKADDIVIETNQGGDLVIRNLKTSGRLAPIHGVQARRGKFLRAEPIAALYERNLVRHVGTFAKLESQMLNFNQHENKGLVDIVDSTVYALQALVEKVETYTLTSEDYFVGDPRTELVGFRLR